MIVYDNESYPNFFSLTAESLDRDDCYTWEISDRRNDIESLYMWLLGLRDNRIPMIGYNNIGYDYVLLHEILKNPLICTAEHLYSITDRIINNNNNRFENTIWPRDRLIQQIDLYLIWHFDNVAKRQSLKGLEFNMRSESIENLPVEPGTRLTPQQMDETIIYNRHDVAETKRFALISKPAIEFRQKLFNSGMLTGDVVNFNDTKIGKELLIQRLGDNVCYERTFVATGLNGEGYNKRSPRQTVRSHIPLKDVIFPYIRFNDPEFQRVHQWMLNQTLEPSDISDDRASTKGVFKGVHANIDGFNFHFGTGGIHGSVERRVFRSTDTHVIVDADVASLYPSIAIVNRLAPEHLGEPFIAEYAALKEERFKYPKGTPENGAFKLGLNGAYGDSNNPYSSLYDPKFTMSITINGQLMLCLLAEWLRAVPGIEFIQINTDGITVRIPRTSRDKYDEICTMWQRYTLLELEYVDYSTMWIRDVNSYIAQKFGKPGSNQQPELKLKGAYWSPDPLKYEESISNAGPPAWHKDLGAPIVQRAAVAQMVYGVPIEQTIGLHHDPFDFCLRAKATNGADIYIGDRKMQRITRYFVSHGGAPLIKISPPVKGAIQGAYKRKNGVSQYEYDKHDPFIWNEAIHTKNKSKYEDRRTEFNKGWNVSECNRMTRFSWSELNHDWYIQEARKLLIEE